MLGLEREKGQCVPHQSKKAARRASSSELFPWARAEERAVAAASSCPESAQWNESIKTPPLQFMRVEGERVEDRI